MTNSLFELKLKLVDFAARHSLCAEFEYDTLDDRMEIRFENPRTHTCRTFRATSEIVVDDAYRSMVKTMFDTPGLIDRMEKPEWMEEAIDTEPKKIFITTARGNGRSVMESSKDILRGDSEPEFLQKKFNIEIDEQWKRFQAPWMKQSLELNRERFKRENNMKPTIEKVYFNKPYTIVLWSDKTKTMVKAEGEAYDEEKGLAMAICKKFLGTNKTQGNYFDEFKKWLPENNTKPVVKEVYLTVKEFAKISDQGLTAVRKDCAKGLHPGAKKVDGKWMIPYEGMTRRK